MPFTTPPTHLAPALPAGIEIFKPGVHRTDAGDEIAFSAADLAGMVASYDPALREAPLTVGHPAADLPAYGWVRGLAVNADGRLTMNTHNVEPQFAEMVRSRRFAKRSAAFYPPQHPSNPKPGQWYLRHVAFLGAQPPAVAGLKDIEFSEADATGVVRFSADADFLTPEVATTSTTPEKSDMSKDLQDKLAEAEQLANTEKTKREAAELAASQAQEKLVQFAEAQRQATHSGHVQFAEGQVQAGRLLPKDKASAVAVLDVLAAAQPVEFSEGDTTHKVAPADWLKGLIAGAKPLVQFGEHAAGHAGTEQPPKTDAEIDTAARAYSAKHNVSYAEALGRVVSFTGPAV